MTTLSSAQRDPAAGVLVATAAGVLVATAAGDALGAGYEFGPPLPTSTPVGMVGGGGFGWTPGDWTDDTSMAMVIAQNAAAWGDLHRDEVQDHIAQGWIDWARTAPDVGTQTRAVLSAAERAPAGGQPQPRSCETRHARSTTEPAAPGATDP